MQMRMPRRGRAAAVGAVACLALGGGAVAAVAQDPAPPALNLAFGADGKLTFSGQEAVVGKAATIAVASADPRRRAEHAAALFRLRPDVTLAEFQRRFPRVQSFNEAAPLGVVDAFVGAPPNGAPPLTSQTAIVAGATYVVLDFSGENPTVAGSFVPGTATPAARLPDVETSTSMKDYAFNLDTLPRKGTIRITNRGKEYHEMFGFRVAKGAEPERVQRTLRAGREPKSGVNGEAFLQGPVGPGAVNQTEYAARRGTYVMACFLPDDRGRPHVTRGMTKIIRVR